MTVGERTSDYVFMERAFQDLAETKAEFPIKVEGAKTLPYTAVLMAAETGGRTLKLKLFRPLPPALASGAAFDMVFSALGKRYEGQISLVGRIGYLQYEFRWPRSLLASDRRMWKRYGFRPRENVFILAQYGEMPCHGLTGPVLNLSMGGLQFRVDRMVRLDDGLPVRPDVNRFSEGLAFSLLRIQGLAKTGCLEARGRMVRVESVDSSVHLALAFSGMADADRELLTRHLEGRERKGTSGFSGGTGSGRILRETDAEAEETIAAAPGEEAAADPEAEPAAPPGPAAAGAEALRRLDRRSARLLVVAPSGDERDQLVRQLQAWGFWRLDLEPDLFAAHARIKAEELPYRMLVLDLGPSLREGLEALGAVRHLEPLLRSFGELPVAFVLRQPDPVMELLGQPNRGVVALEAADAADVLGIMDRLLDLAADALQRPDSGPG
jgi:hypothetical protein